MTQEDELFEDLKNQKSWSKISIVKAKGSLYKALDRYFEWVPPKVEQCRLELNREEEALAKLKAEHQSWERQVTSDHQKAKDVSEARKAEEEALKSIKIETELARSELNQINGGLGELANRSITKEIVAEVAASDVKNSAELLSRIKTLKMHEELKTSNIAAEVSLKETTKQLAASKKDLEDTGVKVRSVKNELDQFQRAYFLYTEALALILTFLQRGYSSELIRGLFNGLAKVEIATQPRTSIERFLNALENLKSLAELDNFLRVRRTELASIEDRINEAKGIYAAYKNTVIKAVDEVVAQGKRQISTVGSAMEQQLESTLKIALEEIQTIASKGKATILSMQNLSVTERDAVLTRWENVMKNSWQRFSELYFTVDAGLKNYKEMVDKWGAVKEEAGRKEAVLYYGTLLFAIVKDKEAVRNIPPDILSVVAERLHYWATLNHATLKTLAPTYLSEKEWGISKNFEVQLISLTAWVRDVFQDIARGAKS